MMLLLLVGITQLKGVYASDIIGQYPIDTETLNTTEYYQADIRTANLGHYSIEIESHEIPLNEYLPIIGKEYFPYTVEKYETEVDNNKPSARYDNIPVTKVDICYNNSLYAYNTALSSALSTMVKELDSLPGLDVEYSEVKTQESYLVPYQYIKNVGNNNMGVTGNKDYISGSSEYTTINIQKMVDDGLDGAQISISWFVRVTVSGGSITYIKPNSNKGYAGYTATITGSTSGTIYTYDTDSNWGGTIGTFTLSKNGMTFDNKPGTTYPLQSISVSVRSKIVGETDSGAYGYGVELNLGKWTTGYRTSYRPTYLSTALPQMTWRNDSIKFVIYGNHDELRAYKGSLEQVAENIYFNEELALLTGDQIYYIGVGSTSNQNDFKNVIDILKQIVVGDDNSAIYIDGKSNLANKVNTEIKEFILSKLPIHDASVNWILVNTEVYWNTTYEDYENDVPLNFGEHDGTRAQPQDTIDIELASTWNIQLQYLYNDEKILAEKWRYRHYNNFFDNSPVQESYHNAWIEDPVEIFPNPGKYRINYKRKDNPLYENTDTNDIFDSYRYWSTDYDYKMGINT